MHCRFSEYFYRIFLEAFVIIWCIVILAIQFYHTVDLFQILQEKNINR